MSPALSQRVRRFVTIFVAALAVLILSAGNASAATPHKSRVSKTRHAVVKVHKKVVKKKVVKAKKKVVKKKRPVKRSAPISAPAPTPAPTPAPAPAGPVPTPVPVSPSSDFPNANNTGVPAGITLKAVPAQATSGAGWHWAYNTVVVDTPGATIVGLDIAGALQVNVANVTIADTRVRCTGESNWCASLAPHSTLVDSEVGGGANGATFTSAIGIWTGGPNNVIQRVNIHHTSDGLRTDGGTSVLDSWIHSLVITELPGVHSDGSQSTAGTSPMVFNHNTIEGGTNDAIFIQASGSVTITNNYLIAVNRGGYKSSYGIGGGNSPGNQNVLGPIVISNNTFSSGWEVAAIQQGGWPAGSSIH